MEHETFFHLDSPVIRVTGKFQMESNASHEQTLILSHFLINLTGVDVPMPYAQSLEAAALPQTKDVVAAVKQSLNVK